MSDAYRTLTAPCEHEIEKIKGSRFVALATHAADPDAAERFVQTVRERFPDASHHCYAWRLARDDRSRTQDDGEPGGSAGAPILRQIDAQGLADVVVVVVRWFGGTRLGVGGLIRAYGGAAGELLRGAPVETTLRTRSLRVRFPYDVSGAVQSVLTAHGLEPAGSDYGAEVRLDLEVPVAAADTVTRELRDRTAGAARIESRE